MIAVWIILALVVIIGLYIISTRNSLVVLRNKVKDGWSQIDIQLKKRFDLIPNLVETVKGYAKHEKDTFKEVIEARNSFNSANTPEEEMKANTELTGAVTKLFALAEAYPELKSDTSFLNLQQELKDVEEKISYARQFYNDTVLMLNNKIELFPSNFVASMFGFKQEAFFEANETERENVKVQF